MQVHSGLSFHAHTPTLVEGPPPVPGRNISSMEQFISYLRNAISTARSGGYGIAVAVSSSIDRNIDSLLMSMGFKLVRVSLSIPDNCLFIDQVGSKLTLKVIRSGRAVDIGEISLSDYRSYLSKIYSAKKKRYSQKF